MANMRLYIVLGMVWFIWACAAGGPEYDRPKLESKQEWSRDNGTELSPSDSIQADWWTHFEDPYLDRLIEDAVNGNYDLKVLLSRIREAGATLTETRADNFPKIDASAGAEFTSSSGERLTEGTGSSTTESYSLRSELSWEADLWGKKKRAYLATKAGYKASEADYRAGYLKLVVEVAQAYFQLRQKYKEAEITEKFYKDNQLILTIYENQFDVGIVSFDKVLRQKAQVDELKRNLSELRRESEVLENRITTLIGKPAGEMEFRAEDMTTTAKIVEVPVGLPSDLLARRPDIIAAEYRILEAYHRVGEAQAERMPSISLTGTGGLVSSALSSLLSGGLTLGLVPKIEVPVFDAGKRSARIEMNKASAQSAEDTYRKTVMTAFEEVENALSNLANRKEQKMILKEKTKNLWQVRQQSLKKLELGLISQLEVLDVENELFQSEKSLVQIDRFLYEDTVTLYKALGGGWPRVDVQ
jgi:NodT family efflux transporter outer membrane factor (OMF) lipoprotein